MLFIVSACVHGTVGTYFRQDALRRDVSGQGVGGWERSVRYTTLIVCTYCGKKMQVIYNRTPESLSSAVQDPISPAQ